MAEDVVLVAVGAVGALQAANQQHGYTYCNQNSDGVSVVRKPVNQAFHSLSLKQDTPSCLTLYGLFGSHILSIFFGAILVHQGYYRQIYTDLYLI
jgi:hypothetical protein